MKKYLFIYLNILILNVLSFSQTDNLDNVYLDKTSQKYDELLSVLRNDYEKYEYHERANRIEDFKKYYLEGFHFYNDNNYEKAIDNYILACKVYTYQVVYYQLGLALMAIGDFENAKNSFKKSISSSGTFYRPIEDLYTFDNNGLKRESYFAYYNIACIESLRNEINTSYDYLCQALYRGYPFISHIKNDLDLENLFMYDNGVYLKKIDEIYSDGFKNTVARKGFAMHWGGAPLEYYFINQNQVICYRGGVAGDTYGWLDGNYEIKNYQIFINNITFYFDESDAFKGNFSIGLKNLENLYEEIPVESYIGRYTGNR